MNNFPDVVINKILLFVSHPCADIIRDHFILSALRKHLGVSSCVSGYIGEEQDAKKKMIAIGITMLIAIVALSCGMIANVGAAIAAMTILAVEMIAIIS